VSKLNGSSELEMKVNVFAARNVVSCVTAGHCELFTSGVLHHAMFTDSNTDVLRKSSIFWDITPCIPLKVSRYLRGIYCLHLQSRKIRQPRKEHDAGCKQESNKISIAGFY
jgi:hypothetical protein